MSKIGGKSINIKEGVSVTFEGNSVRTEGPKGSLVFEIPKGISVKTGDGKVQAAQDLPAGRQGKAEKETRSLFGLTRATIANMIKGVSEGFEKKLELSGVGYRAQISGEDLILNIGYSHPVKVKPEPGIKLSLSDNVIVVSGIDKTLVGNTAAKIRAIRPPEPYKGKGIKYQGEVIRRKVGKAAKAIGATK
ncbi:MAG: 50S ribosomal protein L6 [Candidatus Levybacteria bacterium RIFCSPLOWO2_01_FULL_38_13]|nr:MAG: 50S ribosomal protein L6 [Candidatus Levybacteria bacterium RIFCSPHIGHO2_01_FULL_41_15]OGH34765.1 MAG: 50S ribosomal protein L6 [Candidatus Levybacteria bacterium RIFCSPLOWO2_01_FULL_38_13]